MATGVSECAAVQGHARSPHGPGAHLGNRDRVVPIPAHGCFPAEEYSSGSGGRRGCGGAAFRFTLNALPEGDAGLRSSPPSTTYMLPEGDAGLRSSPPSTTYMLPEGDAGLRSSPPSTTYMLPEGDAGLRSSPPSTTYIR